MDKLSWSKKCQIVRRYLGGEPYQEIATKSGVAVGSVANIVTDLKAGRFPEAGDVGEHVEQLRELGLDLKRANLTPGQCAVGLTVLAQINKYRLQPADMACWPRILKEAGSEEETQEFLRLIYSIGEVQERTGLSLEALDDKVQALEKKAVELESVSSKLAEVRKQLAELSKQQETLANTVANLEAKRKILEPQVKDLNQREHDLSAHIKYLEPKDKEAEEILSTLFEEMQKLSDTGLSLQQLVEFNQSVQLIAKQHNIKPAQLRNRLLCELGDLDEGLGLEVMVQNRQQDLDKLQKAINEAKTELDTTKALVVGLKQEKAKLETSIKEAREQVLQEIISIIPIARDAADSLTKELHSEVDKAMTEVGQLRDVSLETGKEIGRFKETLEANAWLK